MEAKKAKQVTAKAYPAAWNLNCGACGEGLTSDDGSFLLMPEMLANAIKCECGAINKVPAKCFKSES